MGSGGCSCFASPPLSQFRHGPVKLAPPTRRRLASRIFKRFRVPLGGPGGRPFSYRWPDRAFRQRPIDARLTHTGDAPLVCSRSDARGKSMTDHPRFQAPRGPFETAYRTHHGGNLVALILRFAGPRENSTQDVSNDPILALDRALLDSEHARKPEPVSHRSAVRAAVVGICAILLLSAIVHGAGSWRSAGVPNRTAASSPADAR